MTAIGYSGTHGAGADRGVPLPVLRVLLKSEGEASASCTHSLCTFYVGAVPPVQVDRAPVGMHWNFGLDMHRLSKC